MEILLRMIPKDWNSKLLGKSAKLSAGYAFSSMDYVEKGIRLLKISNVSHSRIVWEEKSFLPEHYWNDFPEYRVNKGDIVLAMTRPIISTGLKISFFSEDQKALLNQRVGKFIINDSLKSDFLFYFLNQKYFLDQIELRTSESNQPNISSNEIENILIWYPVDLSEQQKIASILSNVDSLLQQTQKIIQQTQRLKNGLMQRLFTKGIGYSKPKKVQLFPLYDEEEIPESWKVDRLENLIEIIDYRGRTPPFSEKGIIHLRSNNIRDGKINFDEITYVSEETYAEYMTRGIPQENDILFTTEGPLGEVALVPKNFKFSLAQRIIVLRSKTKDLDPQFVKFLLQSKIVKLRYEGLSTGTTLGGIASKWFTKLLLPYPVDITEQEIIAGMFLAVENKIDYNKVVQSKLENLKKGLMQKLLTGQIRVKV